MNETTTPPAPVGKRAGKKGEGKKPPADKKVRAGKLRVRELRVERQGLMKTIQDAKARKVALDAEVTALRAAAPPKAT